MCYNIGMNIEEKLIQKDHLIDMDDIIREGNPTLRAEAASLGDKPTAEEIALGDKMMEFLHNSQDEVIAEKMHLRGGVGLAAPQLDVSKRIIAVLVPNDPEIDEEGNEIEPEEPFKLEKVMFNPRVVSESVEEAAIATGEGCLSVDREVPGYVIRKARVTVQYMDKEGNKKKLRLKGFPAMVVQHEIDHTNGILFVDHIRNDHDAFYQLDETGELQPIDYNAHVKDNDELWQD